MSSDEFEIVQIVNLADIWLVFNTLKTLHFFFRYWFSIFIKHNLLFLLFLVSSSRIICRRVLLRHWNRILIILFIILNIKFVNNITIGFSRALLWFLLLLWGLLLLLYHFLYWLINSLLNFTFMILWCQILAQCIQWMYWVKCFGCILTGIFHYDGRSTWMFINKVRQIICFVMDYDPTILLGVVFSYF